MAMMIVRTEMRRGKQVRDANGPEDILTRWLYASIEAGKVEES